MRYHVGGYEVEFPHAAYGVQLAFMSHVLRALDRRANALLEAPTGCGKTLSLLCAVLAWQRRWREEAEEAALGEEAEEGGGGGGEAFADEAVAGGDETGEAHDAPQDGPPARRGPCPKVYYGSRTHSQIAQVHPPPSPPASPLTP